MKRHFCDWNSGNPVDPRVKAAMQPFFDAEFGNPSSPHAEGRAARRAVEQARAYVASLAGVESRDVVFTSGATESNHLAVTTFGAGRVLFSAVEHPCMVAACEVRGAAVRIPVTATGDVDFSAFDALTRSDVGGCAVMAANNETGVRLSLGEVGRRCAIAGFPLHVDAAQVPGRVPFEWPEGATSASLSAHKMAGPKGVGALIVRPGGKVVPLLRGGSQERDRRAGTENVPAIVGFGEACRIAKEEAPVRARHLARLETVFLDALRIEAPGFFVHAADAGRLPGCLSMRFPGISGEGFVMALDLAGVAVGLGSACSSGASKPSPVLAAMGVGKLENLETVRWSFGYTQSEADMVDIARRVGGVVRRIAAS